MVSTGLVVYYCAGFLTTAAVCFGAVWFSVRFRISLNRKLLIVLCLSSVYLVLFQYLKYRSFHFYADFSHWAQLIFTIARTGKPYAANVQMLIPGTLNYFSVHFVPLVYPIALVFKVFPRAQTLIALNFVVMASAVIPLYKLAFVESKDELFAVLCCFILLWYPAFQYTVLYEFEVLRFSIPVILWMLYFWKAGKRVLYYVFAALAICVREEVSLTVFMFGLYLFLFEKKRWHGLITAAAGLVAFVLITHWVMPSLRGEGAYTYIAESSFSSVGGSPQQILVNFFRSPMLIIMTVLDPIKLVNLFMFFAPLLFVPYLSPYVLVGALPSIAVGTLSSSYTHSSFLLYYMSAMVPFVFYAFIKAWPRFVAIVGSFQKRICAKSKTSAYGAAFLTVFLAAFSTNLFFGPSLLSLPFWFKACQAAPLRTMSFHYSGYTSIRGLASAERLLGSIPVSATVSTQQFFAPRLYDRRATLIFPALVSADGRVQADYVFFDTANNGLSMLSPASIPDSEFEKIRDRADEWQLVSHEGSYFLYRRVLSQKGLL